MQLDLRKQDLAISTDGEGKQYVHLSTSFSQKNHFGGLSSLSDDVSRGGGVSRTKFRLRS